MARDSLIIGGVVVVVAVLLIYAAIDPIRPGTLVIPTPAPTWPATAARPAPTALPVPTAEPAPSAIVMPTVTIVAPTATTPPMEPTWLPGQAPVIELTPEQQYQDAFRAWSFEMGRSHERFSALMRLEEPEFDSNHWREAVRAEVRIWRGVATQAHRTAAPAAYVPLHERYIAMLDSLIQSGNDLEVAFESRRAPLLRRGQYRVIERNIAMAREDFLFWLTRQQ